MTHKKDSLHITKIKNAISVVVGVEYQPAGIVFTDTVAISCIISQDHNIIHLSPSSTVELNSLCQHIFANLFDGYIALNRK